MRNCMQFGKMIIQYYARISIDEFDYCFLSLLIVFNDLFLHLFLHCADESFPAEASHRARVRIQPRPKLRSTVIFALLQQE